MKLPNIYYPSLPSEREFVNGYNENLQELAKRFWHEMSSISLLLLAIAVCVSFGFCLYYYGPYNNRPNRHYLPFHWWKFMLVCVLSSFAMTWIAEIILVKTTLNDTKMTMPFVALQNAVYSLVVYGVVSIIWCNWWSTKAYRYCYFNWLHKK